MNPTIELLKSHRSIRKFTEEPVPQATLEAIVSAGQAAPTSSFIQACTVIQVDDPADREQLAEWAGNQAYVAAAARFLVVCADMQRHRLACSMHDQPMQSGFTEQFITATVDCGLFAQNMLVAAESLGLGVVFIGGLRNRIDKVADLLGLPELVYPAFGMCLGHPAQDPETKPRLPLPVVLKQGRYDDGADAQRIAEYDEQVRDYYRTRTGNRKSNSWSEQISDMLTREARPHMQGFLQARGFLLK